MRNLLLLIMLASLGLSFKNFEVQSVTMTDKPAKVEVVKNGEQFQLLVNGTPFYINGAGIEYGKISSLAKHNGNSFRTWRTDNGKQTAKEVLDEAHKNGLMVLMGIEVARERHGFDYNDTNAVEKQYEDIKQQVMALKDHPALLMWGIGNELNLRYTNPKVWDAVNDISKMIHEIDPNHPTTTSLAGISQQDVTYIKEKCNDVDILSVQLYGKLPQLPQLIKDYGWTGPYIVTEWGATGHWEVKQTDWGAPIEDHSSLKADNYLMRYQNAIEIDKNQCLGSYVFLWGQKQERTPTWYGLFLENGDETETIDVMHYLWNNKTWPNNRAPRIVSFVLDKKTAYENVVLEAAKEATATILVKDFEKDTISYRWELLQEATKLSDGGDYEERPASVNGILSSHQQGTLTFEVPSQKGNYRLFVYASDGNHKTATANIPFKVK